MNPWEYQSSVLSGSDAGKAPARDATFIWMVACSTPIRLSPPKPKRVLLRRPWKPHRPQLPILLHAWWQSAALLARDVTD